jgi:hypothetical protein
LITPETTPPSIPTNPATGLGDEPAGIDRECLGPRLERIDRVNLGVENDEIGILRGIDRGGRYAAAPPRADETGDTRSGQAHELSAAVTVLRHRL